VSHNEPTFGRFVAIGAVGWLAATAALQWSPVPIRLNPNPSIGMLALMLADGALFAAVAYRLVRRLPRVSRLAACGALVMPGALGDAIGMVYFKHFFPPLNADGSNVFAALLLLTYGVILLTGFLAGVSRANREVSAGA
jgi:hypothetical protein